MNRINSGCEDIDPFVYAAGGDGLMWWDGTLSVGVRLFR